MALSFDPNRAYLVTLIGGPHAGDTPAVNVLTTSVTNESSGAIYQRDEAGQYVFSGYEHSH